MSQMKISAGEDDSVSPTAGVAANEGRPGPVLPPQQLPQRKRSASKRNAQFLIATILSIVWIGACASYVAFMALSGKYMTLDAPNLAAMAAGVSAPLAVIWLIALYLRNAADSRLNQALLTNPAALTSQQVSAMSASIAEGAHRLTEAAEIARNRVAEIEDGMARHTSRLLDVAETAARNADYVKSQLKSQNDALIGLVKDLTSRSDQIEAIVSTATSNLFGATDQAVLKAEQAGSLLATHAETLTEATQRAESLRNGIEDTFQNSAERIRDASLEIDDAFGRSISKMRDASKQATDEAENVGKTLAEHSLSLTVAADHAADRAGFIARRLHKEVDELGQIADQVSTRTDQISASFSNQGKAITDAAADFEHLAGQINVTAEEARRRLEDETRSHAQEMQRVSELAAEKASETVKAFSDQAGVLQTTSEGIIGKVHDAGAAFVEQSEKIDEIARDAISKASSRIDQARVKLDEHLARLTRVTELAEALTNSLSGKFSAYVDQLSAATDQASSEAEVIGASFRASGDSLMDVTRMVGERTEHMRTVLDSERGEMERLARDLRAQGSEMEDSMKAHSRNMEDAAERAANWADTASNAFKHQTEEMTGSADAAARRLMEQYANHAQTVTSAAESAVDSVVNAIEEKIRSHSMEVAWISEQAATRAEETLSGIVGETRKFAAQTDAQFVDLIDRFADAARQQAAAMSEAAQDATDRIATAGSDFKSQAGEIETAASGISTQLADAGDKLSGMVTRLGEEASDGISRVDETFTEKMARMDELVADKVASIDQEISNKIAHLDEEVSGRIARLDEDMSGRMARMSEEISATIDRLGEHVSTRTNGLESVASRLAATLAAKLAEAKTLLDQHAELLDTASDNAASNIASAGDEFSRRSTELETAAKMSREYIEQTTEAMREEMGSIAATVDEVSERIKQACAELDGRDLGLKSASDQAVAHLTAAGNLLDKRSADLHEKSAAAREDISRVGDLFDQKILTFARAATSAKTGLLNAGKSLDESTGELDDRSKAVVEALTQATHGLRNEIRRLDEESSDVLARLGAATAPAKRHAQEANIEPMPIAKPATPAAHAPAKGSDSLSPATQSFLAGAKLAMKSVPSDRSRNDLLTAAAYIVECAETVGVDTLEVFDFALTDKQWERYIGGEETLMGHTDVLLGSRKSRAVLRHRYTADPKFKAAASTYLTWFGDAISNAASGGGRAQMPGLLKLLVSDMGTLYAFMLQAITLRL